MATPYKHSDIYPPKQPHNIGDVYISPKGYVWAVGEISTPYQSQFNSSSECVWQFLCRDMDAVDPSEPNGKWLDHIDDIIDAKRAKNP